MEKLLIVDGNSLANRAFYALPPLQNQNGEYSNAIYGFVNILLKFINEQKPTHIAVAFDHSRHTFRTDMYAEYKGTRKAMPDELRFQMPILKQLLCDMGIKIYEVDGIEADDIIGTIAKNSNIKNIVLSGDRDVLQLVDSNTEVWITKKGVTDVVKVEPNNIKELYGCTASQIIDLKALMGDSSDNIPGVAGIGEKTAKSLLEKYSTLDNIYQNIAEITGKLKEKLVIDKDKAYLSYKLATIKTDCDIDVDINQYTYDYPFNEKVKETFERFQFKTLLKRQDVFKVDIQPKIQAKIVELNSLQELQKIFKNEINYIAFNFINKIEFCINQDIVYTIPAQMTLLSSISLQDILVAIKPLLLDEKVQKITYDLKSHYHLSDVFRQIKGDVFDISIAQYLINAGAKQETPPTNEFYNQKFELKEILYKYGLDYVYDNIETPLVDVLYQMEQIGFKIDTKQLDSLTQNYQNELKVIESNIYELAGHQFNIKSPKQLAQVLFEELNLSTAGNKKHSTGIDILNSLQNEHPIILQIIRYRKIQKLTSTYLEVYQKLVKEKGDVIHTIFNQTLTSTGRLSSSEPNLQNIPVRDEEGKNLRKLFISSFDDGEIIAADYNQIELRLLAHMSNDATLIDTFINNKDIHTTTAAQIFEKDASDVTSKERSMAKAVNFGIVYGMSAFGLAEQINTTPKQAKDFMNKYFETYSLVPVYMNSNIEFARKNGYVKTIYGRIRKIAEINASNKITQQFGERVAMNMPLQGTASDIIKLAMIKVSKELKNQNLKSKLILQIHDELIVDTHKDEIEQVKKILKNCMESVVQLKVPLIAKIEFGKTWYDAK